MPGTGVNRIRILRIDGERLDVLHNAVIRGNPLPVIASIGAAVYTIQCPSNHDFFIRRRNCHGAHALVMHRGQGFPVYAAILGAKDVARVLIQHAPRRNKNSLLVVRIERDVVEHVIVASSQLGVTRPAVSVVLRDEKHPGTGSEKNSVRVMRIISKTADIAAIRPQNAPLRIARNRATEAKAKTASNLNQACFIKVQVPQIEKVGCES